MPKTRQQQHRPARSERVQGRELVEAQREIRRLTRELTRLRRQLERQPEPGEESPVPLRAREGSAQAVAASKKKLDRPCDCGSNAWTEFRTPSGKVLAVCSSCHSRRVL